MMGECETIEALRRAAGLPIPSRDDAANEGEAQGNREGEGGHDLAERLRCAAGLGPAGE